MNNSVSSAIEMRKATKVFRDFWRRPKVKAVDGLSFTVKKGEIFGLLGPNGSGKSTTIKLLLGLLFPDDGDISILGAPPRDVGVKEKIGYLPEESYLHKYLTAREALQFYGRLYGINKTELERRVEELLVMTGLIRHADRAISEFSKGMTRRVGLAQALINNPELIILDEPTAGLDPIACRRVKSLLCNLRLHGKTILLSSHLLADVEDVCDRISIMYSGRTRAEGGVKELLEQTGRIRFNVPALSEKNFRTLVKVAAKKAGEEPIIDHPSIRLEDFFVRVFEDVSANTNGEPVAMQESLPSFLRESD
ncbi:MAG: ABC transporter ATP-binding protein [Verrucomicrobiota bacterium]